MLSFGSWYGFQAVGKALFRAHVEGQLKVTLSRRVLFRVWIRVPFKIMYWSIPPSQSEIMSKPELFVEPDPELPLALLDQKEVPYWFVISHNCDVILLMLRFYGDRLVKSFCLLQTLIIITQTRWWSIPLTDSSQMIWAGATYLTW